jgi:phosphoglycolate phosphatase
LFSQYRTLFASLAQGFLSAIQLEAGTAIQQAKGGVRFHGAHCGTSDGKICNFFVAPMAKRYDLIVFDWDGTLMDSTAIITGSIQQACRDLDLLVPDDNTARHVIGLGLNQALRYAVPDAPEAMYEPLVLRYRHHFLSQDKTIPLFAGVRETIEDLHRMGYWLAVATGKNSAGLERALMNTDLKQFFHATRTAEQTFSKPHPAMLQEIMEELSVTPANTLMIGDTTHDIQMAINAGVDAVAVGYGAHPHEQLQELNPLAFVRDVAELTAWLRNNA